MRGWNQLQRPLHPVARLFGDWRFAIRIEGGRVVGLDRKAQSTRLFFFLQPFFTCTHSPVDDRVQRSPSISSHSPIPWSVFESEPRRRIFPSKSSTCIS